MISAHPCVQLGLAQSLYADACVRMRSGEKRTCVVGLKILGKTRILQWTNGVHRTATLTGALHIYVCVSKDVPKRGEWNQNEASVFCPGDSEECFYLLLSFLGILMTFTNTSQESMTRIYFVEKCCHYCYVVLYLASILLGVEIIIDTVCELI